MYIVIRRLFVSQDHFKVRNLSQPLVVARERLKTLNVYQHFCLAIINIPMIEKCVGSNDRKMCP